MADLSRPLTARENSTHVARSVALALPSLIPHPALRTFPSPTNQQMALHPLRPPHSTWIQSGALNKTDVLEPLFSLKVLRLHIRGA